MYSVDHELDQIKTFNGIQTLSPTVGPQISMYSSRLIVTLLTPVSFSFYEFKKLKKNKKSLTKKMLIKSWFLQDENSLKMGCQYITDYPHPLLLAEFLSALLLVTACQFPFFYKMGEKYYQGENSCPRALQSDPGDSNPVGPNLSFKYLTH